MNEHKPPVDKRRASLFRNGRNQAVRIPVEFEMPGDEVLISRDGDRLIIEPKKEKESFLDVLERLGPLSEADWPDIADDDLAPLDDINL